MMRISPFKNHITPLSSPSLLKKPCFGNSEEAERGDNNNKTLAIATGIATLVTIGGIAYLCKTPTTSKNKLEGINQLTKDINNKYSDILEWVNTDLKFHKKKALANIKLANTPEAEKILEINDNSLIINENALNNIDDFLTSKIKNIKENNILNIKFSISSGKEANPIPANVRVLTSEINKFETGELKTSLEKIKLALRLIQVEQATNLLTTEPLKYLEQIINGPLKNSSKTKGLLTDIEKIKQLSTKEQVKLLLAYKEKGNCAWAQDHPIKSLLKDSEINLKLYFHPNEKKITPTNSQNKIKWDQNKIIVNKTLKELDTPDCKYIYIADPYIFRMGTSKIKTFLKEILDGINDKEIRIITINLPQNAKKALQNNNMNLNNKIVIKNLISKELQKPFHDRWFATSQNEFALTNSLNNTAFDISALKSQEHYYKESERLWNANETSLNCIIEEILV